MRSAEEGADGARVRTTAWGASTVVIDGVGWPGTGAGQGLCVGPVCLYWVVWGGTGVSDVARYQQLRKMAACPHVAACLQLRPRWVREIRACGRQRVCLGASDFGKCQTSRGMYPVQTNQLLSTAPVPAFAPPAEGSCKRKERARSGSRTVTELKKCERPPGRSQSRSRGSTNAVDRTDNAAACWQAPPPFLD